MAYQNVNPGAWVLTGDLHLRWNPLYVPPRWQQAVTALVEAQRWSGYRRAPVRSLVPAVLAALPPGVQALPNAWEGRDTPWLNAPDRCDPALVTMVVRGWVREHFQASLGDLVEETLEQLDDRDWQWSDSIETDLSRPPANPLDAAVRYQLLPHIAAQRFLQSPTVVFGGLESDPEVPATFYRLVTDKGSELMSWPPIPISGEVFDRKTKNSHREELGFASIVLRFVAQTVPGRAEPLLYHSLSLRRFGEDPFLVDGKPRSSLYDGVTALVGTPHRLYGGDPQPFTFIPMQLKYRRGEVFWPRALEPLLSENRRVPEPTAVAVQPMYKWGSPGSEVQVAIQYSTRQGTHGISTGGVSPHDATRIDADLAMRSDLGLQRAGLLARETEQPKKYQVIDWAPRVPRVDADKKKRVRNSLETRRTPMVRAAAATPAVFNPDYSPLRRILVLYRNPRTADLLIGEIRRSLQLMPSGSTEIYRNSLGQVEVLRQYIEDDLWGYFQGIRGSGKERQRQRIQAVEDLSDRIARSVPTAAGSGRYGALVEIPRQPREVDTDPKLAWRIGLARAGYVNQHLHDLVVTIPDKDGGEPRVIEEQDRAVHAVADLWRQLGVLKTPLLKTRRELDSLPWLVTAWSVRRTQKTTTSGQALNGLVCARTNPYSGVTEVTTPALLQQRGWVGYHEMAPIFIREKWDQSDQDDASATRMEQNAYTQFVFGALRNCLQTPLKSGELPRVLLAVEAHNVRHKLPWLQNKAITEGRLQTEFLRLFTAEESNRIWLVRLRTAEDEEVPVVVPPNERGGNPTGLFRWLHLLAEHPVPLYLSIGRTPPSFSFPLKMGRSRTAEGSQEHRRSRPLELAVIHNPHVDPATVAHLVHQLRAAYPYYASDSRLPMPMPFVDLLVREYAVSSADRPIPVRAEDNLVFAAD